MITKVAASIGLSFLVFPLFGFALSLLILFGLKDVIDAMPDTVAKRVISGALNLHQLGALLGGLGIMILGFCVDGAEYRPKWLFWWMLILGMIWLFYFPAGTMVGLALLIYTLGNRKKFRATQTV